MDKWVHAYLLGFIISLVHVPEMGFVRLMVHVILLIFKFFLVHDYEMGFVRLMVHVC